MTLGGLLILYICNNTAIRCSSVVFQEFFIYVIMLLNLASDQCDVFREKSWIHFIYACMVFDRACNRVGMRETGLDWVGLD